MADEFCKVFDALLRRRSLSEKRKDKKRKYRKDSLLLHAEIIVIRLTGLRN